jgi:glycosyltransferase involved in cell wall biosynthesis
MSASKKLILVLGAHRSGTSLCAAAVQALGAELGIDSQYANEENRKGFFEHPDLVDFNDRLLEALGGSWDNPLFSASAALLDMPREQLEVWQLEGRGLLESIVCGHSLVAIKDPRLCQLLDFWLPVIRAAGYDAGNLLFLHTLRDPMEVALSQQARSMKTPAFYDIGLQLAEGLALWLSLTRQALAGTRGGNNYFLTYHGLLADPLQSLERLAKWMGVDPESGRLQDFSESFVDSSLHRSTGDPELRAELEAKIPQLFQFNEDLLQLLANSSAKEDVEQLIVQGEGIELQQFMFNAMTPALSRLSTGCRDARMAARESAEEFEKLRQESAEEIDKLKHQRAELEAQLQETESDYRDMANALKTEVKQLGQDLSEMTDAFEGQSAAARALNEDLFAARKESHELSTAVQRSEAERAHLDRVVQQMEGSLSWRVTRPLRKMRELQLSLRVSAVERWMQFKLKSIRTYHQMELSSPRLAWLLRRLLRPFFRSLNWLMLGRAHSSAIPAADAPESRPFMPMAYQMPAAQPAYTPLVSVIVPNYNHARFLRQRLDSIYSQSYEHIEVILLDDCSQDDSRIILEQYRGRYPERTRLVLNEKNSGGVFHQWEKGFALASGDIVWIAESDDWCSQNFLETLVPYFRNEAIQIAYARTVFMSGSGREQIWTIDEYLADVDTSRWHAPIVDTAHRLVNEAFAIKNIIPNVSSALLRHPGDLELLHDPQWKDMRTCGDWLLYLHLLRGGMLAYSPKAHNYYRIHDSNTSVASYAEDRFYVEHEIIAKAVQHYYRVDPEVFVRQQRNLVTHWKENRPSYSIEAFEACYSLERIGNEQPKRAPNLLMVGYAFCAGGGETFPIQLANLVKGRDYNVTYLDCGQEPRLDSVRGTLRRDIPVVSNFPDLETIVHDFGIDVIHSHHAWVDNVVLDLLPEDVECKPVVTLHGMYETINDYDLKRILPRLVDRSAKMVYTAEKNLGALRRHELEELATLERIDNALDVYPFEPLERSDIGVPEEAFLLTVVSRAIPDKGWAEAIEAVTVARETSGRDIHLVLIGEGEEYERLQKNTPPQYVHRAGFRDNIRSYFAISQLGFLPSRFHGESFPLVIIDCLHAGRPVLASAIGEISYMLGTDDGMAGALFELQDWQIPVPQLADLIATLASDTGLMEALERRVPAAAAKFDPAILADRYDGAYRSVLEDVAGV